MGSGHDLRVRTTSVCQACFYWRHHQNHHITIKEKKTTKKPAYGLVTEFVETFNQHYELVMCCEHLLLVEKQKNNA